MRRSEIIQGVRSHKISHQQARSALQVIREVADPSWESESGIILDGQPTRLPRRNILAITRQSKKGLLPTIGDSISGINASDKDSLDKIRTELDQNLRNREAEHYFQRGYLAETVRHYIGGLFPHAVVGLCNGLIESAGYGASEAVERIAFTAARTVRKGWDGLKRGWNS